MSNPFELDAEAEAAANDAEALAGLSAVVKETKMEAKTTTYHVNVVTVSGEWQVVTRYSEVEKLLGALKKQGLELPCVLPRKRMTSSNSAAAVEERRKAIDAILFELVQRHRAVPEVRHFLQLSVGEMLFREKQEEARLAAEAGPPLSFSSPSRGLLGSLSPPTHRLSSKPRRKSWSANASPRQSASARSGTRR